MACRKPRGRPCPRSCDQDTTAKHTSATVQSARATGRRAQPWPLLPPPPPDLLRLLAPQRPSLALLQLRWSPLQARLLTLCAQLAEIANQEERAHVAWPQASETQGREQRALSPMPAERQTL